MATSFKTVCRELRSQGLSLNDIMRRTGRPKTTIYQHIRDIPLSAEAEARWKKRSSQKFITINHARKGISRLNRHPIFFDDWDAHKVSLLAHLIFDGQITTSACVYTNRSLALVDHFETCMRVVYPYDPIRIESLPGVWRSSFNNVELALYLQGKAKGLIQNVDTFPQELRIEFLRAFFDDEGSVCFLGTKRLVRGYQYSKEILDLINHLLANIGIASTVYSKYNEVYISGKHNIIRFKEIINFTPGVCVNGNRSNSVWKESLEKREILDRMIASFK